MCGLSASHVVIVRMKRADAVAVVRHVRVVVSKDDSAILAFIAAVVGGFLILAPDRFVDAIQHFFVLLVEVFHVLLFPHPIAGVGAASRCEPHTRLLRMRRIPH